MNVAVKPHPAAVEFLGKLTDLIKNGKYKEAAEGYKAFEKEHATADFLVLEALPYRVQSYLQQKIGSTAFSIYSLRHPTWTTEIVKAFEDPAKFEAFAKKLEADVAASKPAPKT